MQPGTSGRFWLESISRSPLPPPTEGSASFKAAQVALQTFTVSVDRDSTRLQRDLFQYLTKSPVKNFLSIIRISHPAPCDHGLLVFCSATLIVACPYLLCNPSFRWLSSALPSPLLLFFCGPGIPSSLSSPHCYTLQPKAPGPFYSKLMTLFLQRSSTSGCHPNYSNDKIT